MATQTTYVTKGIREDLSDVIFNISPTETPFVSAINRVTVRNTFSEWQTDDLDTATNTNKHVEGDDATASSASATVRFGNYTQILTKTPQVSGTLESVDKAGRKSELAYQLAKRGKELKRDLEATVCGTQAADGGGASTARAMAGVAAWLFDNQVQLGTGATTPTITSGAPLVAPTAGTAAAMDEDDLKSAIAKCWTAGGEPNMVLVNATNKQLISTFDGISTQYTQTPAKRQTTIIAGADVYVSDFGVVNIVPSRFMPTGNVYVLDTEMWSLGVLRPMQTIDLSRTGDSTKKMLLTEATLIAKNPKASAKIYTTT